MGILERAKRFSRESQEIDKSVKRLIDPDEMGKIYKVLEFSRK